MKDFLRLIEIHEKVSKMVQDNYHIDDLIESSNKKQILRKRKWNLLTTQLVAMDNRQQVSSSWRHMSTVECEVNAIDGIPQRISEY